DSTFTQTGVNELKAAIETFPDDITAACQSVAHKWAGIVKTDAQRRLLSQTKGEGNTAAAMQIVADLPNKEYIVGFGLIKKRPANLPLWLEYGTIRMNARQFMRPAAEAAREGYRRDMEAVVAQVARTAFQD